VVLRIPILGETASVEPRLREASLLPGCGDHHRVTGAESAQAAARRAIKGGTAPVSSAAACTRAAPWWAHGTQAVGPRGLDSH
jgi:hypothetical protein